MLCASNTYTRTMFPVIFKWISTNVFTSNIYMHVLQQPERILDNTNTMHFPSPSNLHVHSFTLVYNSDGIPVVAWTVLQDQPHIRALTRNHTIYTHAHSEIYPLFATLPAGFDESFRDSENTSHLYVEFVASICRFVQYFGMCIFKFSRNHIHSNVSTHFLRLHTR